VAITLVTLDSGLKVARDDAPAPLAGDGGQALTDNFELIDSHIQGTGSPVVININHIASGTGILTSSDDRQFFGNSGAIEEVRYALPAATAGIQLSFIVVSDKGLRVIANGANQIYAGVISGSPGGYISSSGIGSETSILAVDSNNWFMREQEGIWIIQTQ